MRVKLTFIEKDFRGNRLSMREEILQGESQKNLTRGHVARLIQRHHPELSFACKVTLSDAYEDPHRWHVKTFRVETNHWMYVYADPLAT